MKILDGIRYDPSPNSSAMTERPTVIVLHSTGGAFDGAVTWLKNPASKASAHFVVSRTGEVVQLVALDRRAWHAGRSAYRGRANMNAFSLGIEQEHVDGQEDWPDAQVRATAAVCARLMRLFSISAQDIVSHAAVARPVGRKVDPVAYPWEQFRAVLEECLQPTTAPGVRPGVQIGAGPRVSGEIVDGTLRVPARALLEALGVPCAWHAETKTLVVTR